MANARIRGHGIAFLPENAGDLVRPAKVLLEAKDRTQARRTFAVSNLETVASGNIIYVGGSDNVEAFALFPQDRQFFDTDDVITIINPNADRIRYVAGEVFLAGQSEKVGSGGQSGGSGGGGGDSPSSGSQSGSGARRQYLP